MLVHVVGHDEAEHGVAEELEAFVRHRVAVLRAPRPVHERGTRSDGSTNAQPSAPRDGGTSRSGRRAITVRWRLGTRGSRLSPTAEAHDIVDGVAHGAQVGEVFVVDGEADGALAELLLERLDQLDERERVGIEVVGEGRRRA